MPINYLKKIQLGDFNAEGYRISPGQAFESVIEGFYVFSRVDTVDTQLIFNDGYPVLVFLQQGEDSITVLGKNNAYEVKGAWASAGAIKNVYINYNQPTAQVFIVRFQPSGFYQLFGLKAQHFRNQPLIALESIASSNNFNLTSFFKCHNISSKINFIETHLLHALPEIYTPKILAETLAQIRSTKGNQTVRNLTDDIGVNYKWLERSFIQHIGLLPKEYIQLQRFIHAYLELVGSKEIDLMRIAVSNGYYDSNHFLKDFKVYTGKTPLAYLKLQS
jgi:AraC-like DNA-binding protein